MTKYLYAFVLTVVFMGGSPVSILAQETMGRASDSATIEEGPPRLTPGERRERWDQMRAGIPDNERRARIQQWREGRGTRVEEQPEELGEAPEAYLDQLQFRSLLEMGGITQFTLRNPYEGRTFVVSAVERRNEIEVVKFDSDSKALTLRHGDDVRTLTLQASRVGSLAESFDGGEREDRREMWEARRQQFQKFRETWSEAAESSPELQEIESQFRELGGDFRENRQAMQEMGVGSAAHERLRQREQEMREEFRLLAEYSLLQIQKHPAFAEEDVESLQGLMRGMMIQEGRDGSPNEGRRGR